LVDSIKDVVDTASFQCQSTGISMMAMDSARIALVSLSLKEDGFEHYRCDRNIVMGIAMEGLTKIFKCSGRDDNITLKSKFEGDSVTFIFESPTQAQVSQFQLKLMDIDEEQFNLGIPEDQYVATVHMSATRFQQICHHLLLFGETVSIITTKECVRFRTRT